MLDALLFTKTPSLLTAVYPKCLWKIPAGNKLYLTFDDGPLPEITPFVLDELKKWNARATFFCIGKNIQANPELFKRIINEGHSVGNHTYDHLNGWNTTDEEYYDNIKKCHDLMALYGNECEEFLPKSGVIRPALFRPPYGKLKPAQYKALQLYNIVMWDVLSFDFDLTMSAEKVLDNVLKNTEAGSIIVMHDSLKAKPKVEYALPRILKHFTEKEFKFEKILC